MTKDVDRDQADGPDDQDRCEADHEPHQVSAGVGAPPVVPGRPGIGDDTGDDQTGGDKDQPIPDDALYDHLPALPSLGYPAQPEGLFESDSQMVTSVDVLQLRR